MDISSPCTVITTSTVSPAWTLVLSATASTVVANAVAGSISSARARPIASFFLFIIQPLMLV